MLAANAEAALSIASPGPVGISERDGITFAAPDVLITRNGVTETLKKELQLSTGTRVMPNGSVQLPDKGQITLRPNQVLMFDGRLVDATDTSPVGSGSAAGGATR